MVLGLSLLRDSPASTGSLAAALQKSTNDPGMCMKTNDEAKKSLAGADVAFERLRCAEGALRPGRAGRRTCPFGMFETPHFGVWANPGWLG